MYFFFSGQVLFAGGRSCGVMLQVRSWTRRRCGGGTAVRDAVVSGADAMTRLFGLEQMLNRTRQTHSCSVSPFRLPLTGDLAQTVLTSLYR